MHTNKHYIIITIIILLCFFTLIRLFYVYKDISESTNVASNFEDRLQYSDAVVNLRDLQLQYLQSNSTDEKETIRDIIQHDYATFDRSLVNGDLLIFLDQMMDPSYQ